METFPNTEHGLALLAIIFVGFLAARAWTHGVLKMFWAIIGLALGAAAGFFFFQNSNLLLSRWTPGRELGFRANLFGSVVIALIGYLVFRQLAKTLLKAIFNPEGILSGWSDGFRGSLLSLIPSLATVLIVGLSLRMVGTLLELRSAEKICHPENDYTTNIYPGWPASAEWRNAVERLPYVTDIYQHIDPISRRPERQLTLLLIASKKPLLFSHLEKHNITAPIVAGAQFQSLFEDEEIKKLLAERNHVALLRHPKLVEAGSNEVLAERIATIDLPAIIDEFMLSQERQELLKSYKRPEVPQF